MLWGNPRSFWLKSETKQECLLLPLLFGIVPGIVGTINKTKKSRYRTCKVGGQIIAYEWFDSITGKLKRLNWKRFINKKNLVRWQELIAFISTLMEEKISQERLTFQRQETSKV